MTSTPTAALVRALAHVDVVVTADTATALPPTITADRAAAIAGSEIGIAAAAAPSSATLANVTFTDIGKETQTDPQGPSKIVPSISNRRLWIITFSNARIPALGPPGYTGPGWVTGSVAVFIDPASGEFVRSQTY